MWFRLLVLLNGLKCCKNCGVQMGWVVLGNRKCSILLILQCLFLYRMVILILVQLCRVLFLFEVKMVKLILGWLWWNLLISGCSQNCVMLFVVEMVMDCGFCCGVSVVMVVLIVFSFCVMVVNRFIFLGVSFSVLCLCMNSVMFNVCFSKWICWLIVFWVMFNLCVVSVKLRCFVVILNVVKDFSEGR